MKRLPFLIVLLGLMMSSCKKEGCLDPFASNYDSEATKNDESCIYPSLETVISDDGSGIGTTTLYSDSTYVLDGLVFVNDGQILTIEPGTVIKGRPGTGSSASALVIARGGKIIANGTAQNPIIFTAESDDVSNPDDIPAGTRGLWGGLIVLGKATLNSSPGESAIEGVPTSEQRGIYGGSDDADNSGSLSYISIRYGGTDIGSGNEINGLTFGGVGSGTTVDHIEVAFNKDDGFEFFGGTVQTSYLIAAFCGDDCFDYDEGFRGKGQFWFAIQGENEGDRGGEHDGGTTPEDGTPYAMPEIRNATYIGVGEASGKRTVTFRQNAGGRYFNSVFVDYGKGMDIEILASGQHSFKRFQEGDLMLEGNVFHNVAGNVASDIFTISDPSGNLDAMVIGAAETEAQNYFNTAGNQILDPGMTISRTAEGLLDPIPTHVDVLTGAVPASGTFFENVDYKGAFTTGDNWASGWTLLSGAGYLN